MALLLFALSALFLLAATHPFITYPLTLRLIRRWHYRPLMPAAQPADDSFAICVCAYNEEAVIRQKAENLMALKRAFPATEVLIYVDGASDRTGKILSEYKDAFTVHISAERHGKTHGMNLLVSLAKSPIVIFTDANVMVDEQSIRMLPGYFADPRVGCVCGHLRYVNAGESVTAATGSLYWRLEEAIKQMESDTGSVMGADGSLFAIRRALHTPPPDDIIDDMFVSFSILCDGYRVVRAPDVIAYEKSVGAQKEEFRRKVRIACQAFNVHRLLRPRLRRLGMLDTYKYASHKLLRWLTIYWLGLAALCFAAGMIASGMGTAGICAGLIAIAAFWGSVRLGLHPAPQIADIFGAFAATGIGVWRSLKGERFQTWSPAASIRKG